MENVLIMELLLFIFADGNTFPKFIPEDIPDTPQFLMTSIPLVKHLVSSSSIEHLIVISSHQHEVPFWEMTDNFSATVMFETADLFTTKDLLKNVLDDKMLPLFWKWLNFIVIGTSEEVLETITKAQDLDVEVGKKCVLRHFSRWILIPTDDRIHKSSFKDTLFDNINVISSNSSNLSNPDSGIGIPLHTLMWESGGRILREHYEFLKTGESPFPNVNNGLNGRIVTVAMLEWQPFAIKKNSTNATLMYTGISGEMLNRLSIIFNFSIQYVEPADQQWGEEVNSSWTGIVGMLQQEAVDMCGVPYAVSTKRRRVMSYSYPFLSTHQSAVYRKSVDSGHSWTVLTSCFKWEVYMWGFFTLLSVFILFNIFELTHRFWFGTSSALTCTEIAMLTYSVPLHEGQYTRSASASSKILLSFWWIFCIVLTAVYTGNLVAFLTVSMEYIPFRTVRDLAEQNTYQVGTPSGDFIQLMIKTSNSSVLKSLWEKVKLTKVSSSVTAEEEWQIHTDRLNNEHYVFLLDETSINVLMTERCDLFKIPEDLMHIYSSFTFQKDSPLSLLFADELMYMTEYGLISTWFNLWSTKAKVCVERNQIKKKQLTPGDLIGGFVACTAGVSLATICLIAEYIVYKFCK